MGDFDQHRSCAIADTLLGMLLLHDADAHRNSVTRDQIRQCVAATCLAAAVARAQAPETGRSRLEECLMGVALMVAMVCRALDACEGPGGRQRRGYTDQCEPVAVVVMAIVVICASAMCKVCFNMCKRTLQASSSVI